MGRKRKIPEGYMPRWDSDTDSSGGEQGHSSAMTSDRLPTDTRTSDTKGSVKKKKLPVEEEGQAMQVPPDGLVQEMFETQTEDKAPSTTSQPTSQPSSEEDFQGLVIQVSDDATINDVSQSPLYQTLFSPDYTEAQEQQVDNLEPQELWFDDYYEDEEDNDDDDEEEHDEEDEENKESFNYLFRRFAEDWTTAEVNHRVSKRASAGFWNVARKWMLSLTAAFNKDRKKKFPKYHHTRKKITEEKVPPISLDIGYVHKETGELSIVKDSDKNPIHKFPPDVYEKVYEIGSIKVLINFLAEPIILFSSFFRPYLS